MAVYLETHPPKRSQFRKKRRAAVTGAIVIHTAESVADTKGDDFGAENVAKFIQGRSSAGSYHSIVDSDTIVRLVRYEWEAFHEGTGGNRWSLGLSFATQAAAWQRLPADWVQAAITLGASEARNMADWVKTTRNITIPAKRITAAEYRAGQPGFISHAELDPGRRSDPGDKFPWTDFLQAFDTGENPPVAKQSMKIAPNDWNRATQQAINKAYPDRLSVDGLIGDNTVIAARELANEVTKLREDVKEIADLRERIEQLANQTPDTASRSPQDVLNAKAIDAIANALGTRVNEI